MGRHLANLRLDFLPSSLAKVLPFPLGYSPCPPVSVCGTDTILHNLEAFPGTLLTVVNPSKERCPEYSWNLMHNGFACCTSLNILRESNNAQ